MTKKKAPKAKNSNVPRSLRRLFPNVTEVVDARKSVHVSVCDDDVRDARSLEADGCAMARAVCREYEADGAVVGLAYSYVVNGNKAVRFETPATVAREIVSFDRHHDFATGDYQLCPVPPTQRLGAGAEAARERRREAARTSGPSGPKNQPRIVHKETARVRNMRKAS